MNYRTIDDMDKLLRNGLSRIPKDVELIVGIPRSGMLPATILALYLNLPLTDTMTLFSENIHSISSRNHRIKGEKNSTDIRNYKKILVMDDSCNTGLSINEVKEAAAGISSLETEIVYGCVFVSPEASKYVDLYFEIVPQPRVFEWNIMNHPMMSTFCVDMDGVLCEDPTNEQNDDGEKYIDFILNAKPKWIPKFSIGAIVTSRLEKYRSYTEKWLLDSGVDCLNLIMLDLPSKEERIKRGAHAVFKSEVYDSFRNSELFIESNELQAEYIAKATGKAVYCTSNNRLYVEDCSVDHYLDVKNKMNSYTAKIMGIVDKLISLYDHLDDAGLQDSIINALHSGWQAVVSDMSIIYDKSAYAGIELLNNEAYEYFEKGDYDSCLEILLALPELCFSTVESESDRQICEAAHKVTGMEWNKELKTIQDILSENLLKPDVYDEKYKEEIGYIKDKGFMQMYPYKWTEEYIEDKIEVFKHESGMKYVIHGDHPLFLKSYSDELARHEYSQLIMEQDIRSPHRYFDEICDFREGDIFVDVGAAEGIISLDVIDRAEKVFLIECDSEWIRALNETFRDYKEKVEIIPKYAGEENTESSISLDALLQEYKDRRIFIKMDIEGMELEALRSARAVMKNNHCNLSVAVYHTQSQELEISEFLESMGYYCYPSEGYVLFMYGQMVLQNGKYERISPPYFRRAIVRAVPKE